MAKTYGILLLPGHEYLLVPQAALTAFYSAASFVVVPQQAS